VAVDQRFVFARRQGRRLRRDGGTSAWKNDKLAFRRLSTPVSYGRAVAVGDYQGYVHFLSREDGAFLARAATDGSAISGDAAGCGLEPDFSNTKRNSDRHRGRIILMKPVIALVGRPNVGKSTLFNRMTRSRDALVADLPGLTRDRHYGEGRMGERPFLVIDTGGFEPVAKEGIMHEMALQTKQAVAEADVVMFIVDGRQGLTPHDKTITDFLRKSGRKVMLVVNKSEGMKYTSRHRRVLRARHGRPLRHLRRPRRRRARPRQRGDRRGRDHASAGRAGAIRPTTASRSP
jgi:small GTP-binding protein